VCVLGDLTLGPNAHVAQDVVCVMGHLKRDPGAYVGGKVVNEMSFGPHLHFVGLHNWWLAGLSHGQLLPFGPHVFWLWGLNLMVIFVYVVLALLFPDAMRRTGDMLVLHPAYVLLSGFLALLALPILFVLLLVTVIGIPVAIVLLPVMFFLLVYFGKASLYCLLGRRLSNERLGMAAAVLVGGIIALVMLAFPFAGIAFYLIISYLGFGCAITALMQSRNAPASGAAAAVPPLAPFPSAAGLAPSPAASGAAAVSPYNTPAGVSSVSSTPLYPSPETSTPSLTAEPSKLGISAAPGGSLPPTLPLDASLPRASFWLRTGAMAIDGGMIAIGSSLLGSGAWQPHHQDVGPGSWLILLAIYAAIMWKLKGTTVGGLICHLHVVRLDGRPIDWPTAVVRALGCFVSLFAVGIGFIWVAFDPERQAWHDKLAGTTVVISVTRRSLV
jgi:uncharacterized RDD family membrane protein YckC